jgi:T5SS/PEP-CTERM-associated repeat protein
VEEDGEWELDGDLEIGVAGTGTLDIRQNATMSVAADWTVTMGRETGGYGGASIETGGTWEIEGDLVVGESGTGVLEIADEESRVAVEEIVTLGQNPGGYGTVEVRAGGTWDLAEELLIGNGNDDPPGAQSAFGAVTVRNGGTVNAEGEVELGVHGNGYGILNLIGPGAHFELGDDAAITIGKAGRGELHLTEGATFTTVGHVALGEEAGSNGSATADGEDSTWFADDVTIGAEGAGSVVVSNGGTIDSQSVTFGEAAGASGSGTVTGAGSTWTIGSHLAVGGGGTANLLVESGGRLSVGAPEIIVGEEATSNGVFTLSGTSTVLDFDGDFIVGERGDGAFGLQAGANYSAHNITLGEVAASSGTLSANASTLVVMEELIAGDGGEGIVNLAGGASLSTFADVVLAEKIGSNATATIGGGSTWQANSITVAAQGLAGVNVQSGGQLVTGDMIVAEHVGSDGTVGVDGAASSLRAEALELGGSAEFSALTGGGADVSVTNDGRIFVTHELATWEHATVDVTGGRVTVGDDAPLADHGSLRVNHDGVLAGTGTIEGAVFNAAGEVAPGHEDLPGTLSIEGNFSQAVAGHLKFDIAEEAPPEVDRLNITGSAMLRGTLEASFLDGFVPELGNSFALLFAAGGVNLAFDHFELPDLEAGLKWRLSAPATTLTLSVVTHLSGDYNENGIVDTDDYVVWRKTFGQNVLKFSGADGDGDGMVGDNDYGVWRAHFGETSGSGAGASASVPEPVSYALLIVAAAVLTVVSPRKMSLQKRR